VQNRVYIDKIDIFARAADVVYGQSPMKISAVIPTCVFFIAASSHAGTVDYRYDALGRLETSCLALPGDGELSSSSLDPAGNRSAVSNWKTDLAVYADQSIFSQNGKFNLRMQSDGNLVVYGDFGTGWVSLGWSSNTVGTGANVAYFQSDGNLVLYNSSGVAIWASHSDVNRCASLSVENDGNVKITSLDGVILWQTGTGGH
jgi:hypothetical protein